MKISSDISYVMSFSISWRSHLLTWLQQPHKSFFSLYACLDCTFSSCADETQIPVSSLLSRLQDIYKCLSDLTFQSVLLCLVYVARCWSLTFPNVLSCLSSPLGKLGSPRKNQNHPFELPSFPSTHPLNQVPGTIQTPSNLTL